MEKLTRLFVGIKDTSEWQYRELFLVFFLLVEHEY